MRTTTKNQKSLGILNAILLGLGFFFFSWIVLFPDRQKTENIPQELADEPDYYAKKALMEEYNNGGNLEYQLSTDSVRHYESQQVTKLAKPQIRMLDTNQIPWSIRAKTGVIRTQFKTSNIEFKGDQFLLNENVVVSNEGQNKNSFLLKTETLYLYPESRHIESDSNITLETNDYRITAANMTSHLDTQWIELGSSREQRVTIQALTND